MVIISRKILHCRFVTLAPDATFSIMRAKTISRLEYQPFVLTEEDGFIREDSGAQRHFRAIDDRWQSNTAYQALLKLKMLLIEGKSIYTTPLNRSTIPKSISTVFHLRLIAEPNSLSELSIEGVHKRWC